MILVTVATPPITVSMGYIRAAGMWQEQSVPAVPWRAVIAASQMTWKAMTPVVTRWE